jgi:hypothetical protein
MFKSVIKGDLSPGDAAQAAATEVKLILAKWKAA